MLGLLVSTIVFAQRGGGGGGGGSRGGSTMPNVGFGGGTPFDRVSEMLKLDKDQKKDFKAAMDDAQKEAAPIHEQIVKSRQSIAEAVAGGKSQDDVVKAEGALEAQMAEIEMRTYVKVRSGLEDDQKSRAGSLFLMMRGIFSKKNWNTSDI